MLQDYTHPNVFSDHMSIAADAGLSGKSSTQGPSERCTEQRSNGRRGQSSKGMCDQNLRRRGDEEPQ